MRGVRVSAILLTLALLSGAGTLQAQEAAPGSRRAQLEGRVLRGFLDRTQADMAMTDAQRARIEEIMRGSAERHRELARTAAQLRRELRVAVENEATSEAEFTQLLERMAHLRAQEQNAWQADQRAIAAVLTPRQRAIFSLRWIEFQERMRAVMSQRRGRGGPPQ